MLTNLDAVPAQDAPAEKAPGRPRPTRRAGTAEPKILALPTPAPSRALYAPLRRALDFTTALALTLVCGPFVLLAALAVRLTSRGPAFYTQVRIGVNGQPFTIYKLRTMIHNCESLTGPRWTIPGDPRVTPVGWLLRRTHVDELPQLLNILKGEMSLIGPRPERPEFVTELEKALPGYHGRHTVLPGITGLAQVQLPPDTDVESVRRKLVYDLFYVRHISLLLDARVLLATGLHVVGLSFETLRRVRVVPAVEADEVYEAAEREENPHLHRQAA